MKILVEPELFPVEVMASESPRLVWLRTHCLETEHFAEGGLECPETGDIVPHWVCRVIKPVGERLYRGSEIDGGDTEDEACANLAIARGLKLWNEHCENL